MAISNHDLAEKLAGLASRVNNLAVNHTGADSRELLDLQDRLTKLQLAAILEDLRAEDKDYQRAVGGLQDAIDQIGEATAEIENVAKIIKLVAKAANLAEKAIKAAAA